MDHPGFMLRYAEGEGLKASQAEKQNPQFVADSCFGIHEGGMKTWCNIFQFNNLAIHPISLFKNAGCEMSTGALL